MPKTDRLLFCFKCFKITAKTMHQKTGIKLDTCYRILKGEYMPSYKNLGKICLAYPMLPLRYIFTGS
jgi:predicted transcriptional regulator